MRALTDSKASKIVVREYPNIWRQELYSQRDYNKNNAGISGFRKAQACQQALESASEAVLAGYRGMSSSEALRQIEGRLSGVVTESSKIKTVATGTPPDSEARAAAIHLLSLIRARDILKGAKLPCSFIYTSRDLGR